MRLHDTRSARLRDFAPTAGQPVGIYTCGPTVQDAPHFGHARAAIIPDILRRHLEWRGHDVLHVRNITDVDDKIIAKAATSGEHPAAVAERYGRIYSTQMDRLGVLAPTIEPRATGHIIEMIDLIAVLIEKGSAYEAEGDVYFAVRTFDGYGSLSKRDVDDLRSGARVEPGEAKRDPLDFALWKAAKPGEPAWTSPWGRGRPGWHIECSAMASKYLGDSFDIHTGGSDLIFPHHENEIAQSEAASGAPFAAFWVHNGLLDIEGKKMSKSLGNVLALDETIDRYGADVVRAFFLAADYRSPMELSPARLEEAQAAVERLRGLVRAVGDAGDTSAATEGATQAEAARTTFGEAMDDDLATPRAQAVLFDLVRTGHAHLAAGRADDAAAVRDALVELGGVLGYALAQPAAGVSGELLAGLVSELLDQRRAARERRDFAAADGIRDRLASLGVVVEDTPAGPRWHLGEPTLPTRA